MPSDEEEEEEEDDDGAMDCDDVDVSLRDARSARPRHGSSLSNSSLDSGSSGSPIDSQYIEEPELSQSFGSTKSFDVMTPIRNQAMTSAPSSSANVLTPSPVSRFQSSDATVQDRLSNFSFGSVSPRVGSSQTLSPSMRPAALATSPLGSEQSTSYATADKHATNDHTEAVNHAKLGDVLGLKLTPTSPDHSCVSGADAQSPKTMTTNNRQNNNTATIRLAGGRNPPPGLAGRLKISLPPPSLSSAFNNPNAPQTPGGHIASGARDGAAHGATPVSPFEPPTPLCGPMGNKISPYFPSSSTSSQPRPSVRPQQTHRQSMPVITPIRVQPSTRRPQQMQRNGSMGLSPLSSEFAAVSMKKVNSTKGTASEVSRDASSHVSDGGESSAESSQGSQASVSTTASSTSTLLTPPYSPFQQSKPLLPPEYDMSLDRQQSWNSSTSNVSATSSNSGMKKRNTGGSDSSVGASRTKPKTTAKMAPYPINRENSPARSPPPSQQSAPRLAPTPVQNAASSLLKDRIKPAIAAPPMEKSMSESAVPKTVSGRHLANRRLHPVFSSNYTLGDELGSGGFGFVVRATRDRDGMPVAVKFIWKNKVPTHGWVRDQDLGVIPMEAFVLKAVDHPCVVKFVDLFDDDEFFYLIMEHHGSPWKAGGQQQPQDKDEGVAVDKSANLPSSPPAAPLMQQSKSQPCAAKPLESPKLAVFPPESNVATPVSMEEKPVRPPQAIAMERRSSCDLFECIEQHSRLPEDKAQWVFAQVVEAVYHLDRKGIYHRDIKDENCVVDSDFNVKLIDFGSAVVTDIRKPTPYFNRFFGTMTFASSEILQGKQYRAPHAEMWSLGVLLSILLSGECPFPDPTSAIRGKLPTPKGNWNRDAFAILQACLDVDPERRATIKEVREHPWVAQAWKRQGVSRPN
ncbi:kinase-like protein [Acaromyces ingoldii]|uniref:Kinase-like protein n=1 Tax=Acaromyces ingoldii TaxID=215250 RepID=A0A316YMR4_9BASI|nr:kinase-like protein [Acaromyces ingoldii]PWN90840.1 kinase-like protein [Acaromyces ingoldii]